jgi:hypothetical protein
MRIDRREFVFIYNRKGGSGNGTAFFFLLFLQSLKIRAFVAENQFFDIVGNALLQP